MTMHACRSSIRLLCGRSAGMSTSDHLRAVQVAGDAAAGHLQGSLVAPGAPTAEATDQITGVAAGRMVEHQRWQPIRQRADLLTLWFREPAEPGCRTGRDLPDRLTPCHDGIVRPIHQAISRCVVRAQELKYLLGTK